MANVLITPTIISRLVLTHLKNNLALAGRVSRDISREFNKKGDTINVRKPVKFVASDGATRVNQDVEEANTNVKLDSRKHVSWNFSTLDLTTTVERFSERYAQPAGIALANKVDEDGCNLYKRVSMHVGTALTTPTTFLNFGEPMKRLNQNAVPMDMRSIVIDPEAHLNAADMLKGTQVGELTTGAVRGMSVGQIGGAGIFLDQNIVAHVEGDGWGTPLVAGAAQNVTYANATHDKGPTAQTLNIDGTGDDTTTLKEGDRFTIDGVNAVNPVSKADLGFLQEFVLLADATPVNGTPNTATIEIAPAIITSGPFQTVTAAPADNAALNMVGDYTANLAFHRNAFVLAWSPLELPDGASFKARETHDGFSVRVLKDYDIDADTDIIRMDILYGWKAVHADMATVLLG